MGTTARPPPGRLRRRRPGQSEPEAAAPPAAPALAAEDDAAASSRRRQRRRAGGPPAAAAAAGAGYAVALLLALVGGCCAAGAAAFLHGGTRPAPPSPTQRAAAGRRAQRAATASPSSFSSSSPCRIPPSPLLSFRPGGSVRLFSALADRQPTASNSNDEQGKGKPPAAAAPSAAVVSPSPTAPPQQARARQEEEAKGEEPAAVDAEATAEFVAECEMPTDRGTFRMRSYRCRGRYAALEPVALTHGSLAGKEGVLARIHDQCLTSEVFGSKRCDCKEQLGMALDRIREEGGVVIYLQQEGRGIGLANKVAAYALQDEGLDTVDANRHLGFGDDERTYDIVPSILQDLGVRSIRLLTNNPLKLQCLQGLGVEVSRVEPIVVAPNAHNARYLLTKRERMAHAFLDLDNNSGSSGSNAAPGAALLSRKRHKGSKAAKPPAAAGEEEEEGATGKGGKWDYSRARVQEALAALRAGQPVVLVDGHDDETEDEGGSHGSSHGDLVMAAGRATAPALSTFIRATSGIVYALLPPQRLAELWKGSGAAATAAGIDARDGGGSSAAGRAATLRALGGSGPLSLKDFRSPGHVFAVAPGAAIGTAGDGEGRAQHRVLFPSRVDLRRAWALELVRAAAAGDGEGEGEEEGTAAAAVAEMIDHDTGENLDIRGVEAWGAAQGLCVTSVADVARFLGEEEGEGEGEAEG